MSLYKCASTPELQKVIPSEFENAYFQKWNAGIKEGGSGINVFIKLNDKSIQLDSIYFRDRVSKLNISSENEGLYVGRYKSNDIKTEIPFDLANNDCVISYKSNHEIFYFKIPDLKEKAVLNYPSSPPNN
ncbi:hypothetical protein FBALC1_00440 [Flavobacteriales bacterium ALC-1]|nr:hypothetical protein FBALC1_00440 [Flavobacteriales bacterium ALC-1]